MSCVARWWSLYDGDLQRSIANHHGLSLARQGDSLRDENSFVESQIHIDVVGKNDSRVWYSEGLNEDISPLGRVALDADGLRHLHFYGREPLPRQTADYELERVARIRRRLHRHASGASDWRVIQIKRVTKDQTVLRQANRPADGGPLERPDRRCGGMGETADGALKAPLVVDVRLGTAATLSVRNRRSGRSLTNDCREHDGGRCIS
jgi:hypothetical protein